LRPTLVVLNRPTVRDASYVNENGALFSRPPRLEARQAGLNAGTSTQPSRSSGRTRESRIPIRPGLAHRRDRVDRRASGSSPRHQSRDAPSPSPPASPRELRRPARGWSRVPPPSHRPSKNKAFHQGNFPQCPTGSTGQLAGVVQHYRCSARCIRDWLGILAGPVSGPSTLSESGRSRSKSATPHSVRAA
jgi:hypothetical protein